MGAEFLLTLPMDFSISLHSAQLGGGPRRTLWFSIDSFNFSPLSSPFGPPNVSL